MTRRPALLAILGLSLALNAWGLRYGLPNVYTWAQDEIIPAEVLEAAQQSFAYGWHSRYPPLHYGLMAIAYAPVRALSPPVSVSGESKTYERLFVTGRLLSLAMAMGVVILVYASGLELIGPIGAAFAALTVAVSPTFVYYAKFANLDMPCLFWFSASLFFLIRFLRTRGVGDALGWAAAAALAVGTKDQAYALYVLVVPLIALAVREARKAEGRATTVTALLGDERLRLPGLAAVVLLVASHNLLFNWHGFVQHVQLIVGDASRDYRMFEKSLAGQWLMLRLTLRLLAFVMGEPVLLLSLVGVSLARRYVQTRLLLLVVPIVSAHVFFSSVVLYGYDRFVLPQAVVLALFAGRAVAECSRFARIGPWLRGSAFAGILAFGLLRSISLDLALTTDARYDAERWIDENVPRDARVAVLGTLEYLPRLRGAHWKQRTELVRAVQGMAPDYVVVNQDFASRAEDPRARELYAELASGALGYANAYDARTLVAWPFRIDDYVRRNALPSNLDKINPEIRVYKRISAGAPRTP